MIEIRDNWKVFNMDGAIRGMRNPLNSWDKSDSFYLDDTSDHIFPNYQLGSNDLDLAQRLCSAGTEHRKFLRQIFVSIDIMAPLYWWKEFDTYKVGTVSNSCSTMHTVYKKQFELSDFSIDKLSEDSIEFYLCDLLPQLNHYRDEYLKSKDKSDWWQIIQTLPSTYNQLRTITMNYETVANVLNQRSNHKLDEWIYFCKFCKNNLPYVIDFVNLGRED